MVNGAELYNRLVRVQEEKRGYIINPDTDKALSVIIGLTNNKKVHGRMYCPCKKITGNKDIDRAIICPCSARDQELKDNGECNCGLYVSRERMIEIAREIVMSYRPGRRKLVERWPGDKKSGVCPRCGTRAYDFVDRFKMCTACFYSSWHEKSIKVVKRMIKNGTFRDDFVDTLKEHARYISNLREV